MSIPTLFNRERQEAIANELFEIRMKYGMPKILADNLAKSYYNEDNIKIGSVSKNIKLISAILKKQGFNEEEITEYINRNKNMIINDYSRFQLMVALFYHFGLLEDAMLNCPNIFGMHSSLYKVPIKIIYSVLSDATFKNIYEFREHVDKLTPNQRYQLLDKYPYNHEEIISYWQDFMNNLKQKKLTLSEK